MIEISHDRARRLLRQEVDGRLPEAQWSVLQAHLENCAECRAYRVTLSRQGQALRRALRGGWEAVPGPGEAVERAVVLAAQARAQRQRDFTRVLRVAGIPAAMLGVLALLFFTLGGVEGIARMFQPDGPIPVAGDPRYQPLVTEYPRMPLLPTAGAGEFPEVVVYEARRDGRPDGDSEIYLLNPGAPPVSLSSHPAEDTQPAWSPDGEWIAFLSDRAGSEGNQTGVKSELYVTSLSSTRVVQLTNEPDVEWQGPLSWSPDGTTIALTGIRGAQGGQRWVYLVALDGTGPRSVAGTRGAWSPKFALHGDRLAYNFTDGEESGLEILDLVSGSRVSARWPENRLAAQPALGSAFDWSFDGKQLVFIGSGAGSGAPGGSGAQEVSGSEVVVALDLSPSASLADNDQRILRVANSAWPSAYRAVTWTPGGAVVFLEDLGDARARQGPSSVPGECWQLQVRRPGRDAGSGFQIGGLCVDGGVDIGSWSVDQRWLVVLGRVPGDSRRGIYAVRVPGRGFGSRRSTPTPGADDPGAVLRLADEPFTGALPRVRPRFGPIGSALAIDPRPVSAPRSVLPPSDLTARASGPPGRLVYVVQNNNISVVVATDPDGMGGRVLHASTAQARCPRWSPDGSAVALLLKPPGDARAQAAAAPGIGGGSSLALETPMPPPAAPSGSNRYAGAEELYLLDAEGGAPKRVSDRFDLPESGPEPVEVSYGCPVWSPEGTPGGPYLAVQVYTGRGYYLGVIPVDGGLARYVPMGEPVAGAGPVWDKDGRSLYLAELPRRSPIPRLLRITLPDDPRSALSAETIPARADWQMINGLAVSPDSPRLALLAVLPSSSPRASAFLRVLRIPGEGQTVAGAPRAWTERDPLLMGMNYTHGAPQPSSLTWLPGEALGMVLYNDPTWRYKALLSYYDPTRSEVITLAAVEDVLTGLAWSPDGRWLVYSTESGLWGLDISAARDRRAAPVWLSPVPVQDLDWGRAAP